MEANYWGLKSRQTMFTLTIFYNKFSTSSLVHLVHALNDINEKPENNLKNIFIVDQN